MTTTKRLVEMPGASKWEYEGFENMHPAGGKANALHFMYSRGGKRLADGTDYRTGYYEFDPASGTITWIGDFDGDFHSYRTADGRYIWFDGRDAPIHGRKLLIAPMPDSWSAIKDPKANNVKVLKTFSAVPTLTGGTYSIEQMSPCSRYALVRLAEPIVAVKAGSPGWVNTYYVVNAATGETATLLKEDVRRKIIGFVSQVRWVGCLAGGD